MRRGASDCREINSHFVSWLLNADFSFARHEDVRMSIEIAVIEELRSNTGVHHDLLHVRLRVRKVQLDLVIREVANDFGEALRDGVVHFGDVRAVDDDEFGQHVGKDRDLFDFRHDVLDADVAESAVDAHDARLLLTRLHARQDHAVHQHHHGDEDAHDDAGRDVVEAEKEGDGERDEVDTLRPPDLPHYLVVDHVDDGRHDDGGESSFRDVLKEWRQHTERQEDQTSGEDT